MRIVIDTSKWKILAHLGRYFKRWWRFYIWNITICICFPEVGWGWRYWVLLIDGGLLGIFPKDTIKEIINVDTKGSHK